MDWNDLRFFLALARTGTARAAGASLGVSHSTVARRVEALETELGVRLFDRHRDGYLLTDAARQMMPGAERVEAEMAALERGVAGQDARLEGPVRVTCTDPFVGRMLVGALARLCERHPGLEIEVDADRRYLDLSKREADVAVRAVAKDTTPKEHLLGRKIAPIVLASYVAHAHADRLDPAREGSEARWLGSDRPRAVEALVASSSYPELPVWGAFASISMLLAAIHEGLGVGMLPTYVGDPHPGLRRLTRPDVRHVGDFWLLSHPDLRDNARLRAARECVSSALTSRAPLFAGDRPVDGWPEDAPLRPTDAPREDDIASLDRP
ncbi:MAG TPA: LysR family transcriptional regulator [Sandaracinaceae bacterium LLY-WYZ-13_1]|nr:LysR family transcriptional regulator [Sandaracinaceae bacterium LLY-WYZ-13_1]